MIKRPYYFIYRDVLKFKYNIEYNKYCGVCYIGKVRYFIGRGHYARK